MMGEPQNYDEAVQMVHRAFCDPDHELVGEWDRSMADALRRNGYVIRAVTETPEGLDVAARENADFTDSRGFLGWVHERLVVVYGENPNFDWMLKLDRIATALAHKEDHGG